MRVAALFDVHGNLPALEAVLAESDVAGADLVLSGGDVVPGRSRVSASRRSWRSATGYDREAAAERIRRTGMPGADAFAAEYVLAQHPPSKTAPYFESLATGS